MTLRDLLEYFSLEILVQGKRKVGTSLLQHWQFAGVLMERKIAGSLGIKLLVQTIVRGSLKMTYTVKDFSASSSLFSCPELCNIPLLLILKDRTFI